jgi:hypothetical protein
MTTDYQRPAGQAVAGSATSTTSVDQPWYVQLGQWGVQQAGNSGGPVSGAPVPGSTSLGDLFGGGSDGSPPSTTISDYTGLIKAAALLAVGGIAVYLLWPVLSSVRARASDRHGMDDGDYGREYR